VRESDRVPKPCPPQKENRQHKQAPVCPAFFSLEHPKRKKQTTHQLRNAQERKRTALDQIKNSGSAMTALDQVRDPGSARTKANSTQPSQQAIRSTQKGTRHPTENPQAALDHRSRISRKRTQSQAKNNNQNSRQNKEPTTVITLTTQAFPQALSTALGPPTYPVAFHPQLFPSHVHHEHEQLAPTTS